MVEVTGTISTETTLGYMKDFAFCIKELIRLKLYKRCYIQFDVLKPSL